MVHNGFFETDTKRVLSAAVESLRSENKLLVYSYTGFAAVSVKRDGFLFLDGHQDLIVPAAVSYFVDLSELIAEHVTLDEVSRVMTINLPPLVMGDVAFEPEGARTSNGGLLTFDQDEVDELSKLNYASGARPLSNKRKVRPSLRQRSEKQRRASRAFWHCPCGSSAGPT